MSIDRKLTTKELSLLGDFEFGAEATVVKVGDDVFGIDTPNTVVKVAVLDKTMKTVKVSDDGLITVVAIHSAEASSANKRTPALAEHAGLDY